MRKLHSYVAKYGEVAGPRLYHALQSQAAHAGVSARLRRKIESLTGRPVRVHRPGTRNAVPATPHLPLFPEPALTEG